MAAAVHRFYESRRRIFNDEQPNRIEIAQRNKINARKRIFRKKVLLFLVYSYSKFCFVVVV